jgi:hypothetical protein
MAGGLLLLFHYHLVAALVAGLLVHALLHSATGLLHGPRLSRGAAKFLSAALFGVLATGITAGIVLLAVGFVRGRIGALPALFQRIADA